MSFYGSDQGNGRHRNTDIHRKFFLNSELPFLGQKKNEERELRTNAVPTALNSIHIYLPLSRPDGTGLISLIGTCYEIP
jgi:hypothetical protein